MPGDCGVVLAVATAFDGAVTCNGRSMPSRGASKLAMVVVLFCPLLVKACGAVSVFCRRFFLVCVAG